MPTSHRLFVTTPKAMEPLLADELRALGVADPKPGRAGAGFEGTLEQALRVCLWSRLANRVLLQLAEFPAADAEQLYAGVRAVDWSAHLGTEGTLAVDFASSRSKLTHTQFGAQKVKDAIVDSLRTPSGARPSVDLTRPDVRVNVYVHDDQAALSLDLGGESLHRRGYRVDTVEAPLKENVAAAALVLAGWPEVVAAGGALLDPMCGSGTFLVEAALMALDVAPGLVREAHAGARWRQFDAALWDRLLAEARERDARGKKKLPPIVGTDQDVRAVRAALENVERAGLRGVVHVEKREFKDAAPPAGAERGVVVMNPPYGERLGEDEELRPLYRSIGDVLKQRFAGWTAFVLTGNLELAKDIGLRAARRHVLYNGAIECRLLSYPVEKAGTGERRERPELPLSPGAQMFANRLEKNLKHLRKWAKREGLTCFRVYDADLPEYAVAVDLYERYVHVQEYQPPKTVDPKAAETRLKDVMRAVPRVLEVPPSHVVLKVRRRKEGKLQYEKVGETHDFIEVTEYGHKFLVNLRDYLDTGLFLDHRLIRKLLGELAPGRTFLNLFAYTGTATVYAAKGGAKSTTTVDLSNTYLEWAERNFALNGMDPRTNETVRDDCLEWMKAQPRQWSLILLDVPTFSNSKKMEDTFDVQRDHVRLLEDAARLMTADGVLVFSNNFRRFKMDREALPALAIEDITRKTIPPDFARDPRIHNAWLIRKK